MLGEVVVETNLSVGERRKGKVRDIYDLGNKLLIVATDRISAFDYVLPNPIPNKGKYLTQLSMFWFKKMEPIVKNHVITDSVDDFPDNLQPHRDMLMHRSMLVRKAKVFPIECIVRGYLSGSGWRSYQKSGEICGIKLPPGLRESEQLEEPIFTPSTKATTGHDENITFEKMQDIIGKENAEQLKEISLEIYEKARDYAKSRGIIIADTKFEFGKIDDEIILVDELLTPDSSRFWPLDNYEVGKPQPSFDKQYVRDYLTSTGWDKNSPPPQLPEYVIEETEKKYREAYKRITGEKADFV
ncbi:MAG: phosphoribosylaminoimidazolesuccinocarboxamide synthase [Thermoplasmata archaeon]|nr:MAG: phosphoribosylaminoimidazolesuccinocarboxamide synthase [Thermoplasmata archaeon]